MDDKTQLSPSASTGLPPIEVMTPMAQPPMAQSPMTPSPATMPPISMPSQETGVTQTIPTTPMPTIEPQTPKAEMVKHEPSKGVSMAVVLLVAVVSLIAGLGIGYFIANRMAVPPISGGPSTPNPTGVACTLEAKLCPDGSSVGREGPNCEFAACPGEAGGEMVAPGAPQEQVAPAP